MLLSLIAQNGESSQMTLQPSGMIVMGLSILIVCGLTLFCILRLLREPSPGQHHHTPLDIDTHDIER